MPNTEFSVLGFAIMGIVAVATAIYTYYNESTAQRPHERGGGYDRPDGGQGGWYDDGNDRPDGGRGRRYDDGYGEPTGSRYQGDCSSSGTERSRTTRGNTVDAEYSGSRAYGVGGKKIETGRSRRVENSRSRQHSRTPTAAGTASLDERGVRTNCNKNRRKSEDICAICQESLTDTNITTSQCNHKFHYHCLFEWNRTGNKNCPICRSPTC